MSEPASNSEPNADEKLSPVTLTMPPQKSGLNLVLFVFVAVLFAGSLAYFLEAPRLASVDTSNDAAEQKIKELSSELDSTKARLQNLESRVETLANFTPSANEGPRAETKPNKEEAVHENVTSGKVTELQASVTNLSTAMTALQAEMKNINDSNLSTQESSASLMTSLIMFIELRDAVNAGHSYVHELAALEDATQKDQNIQAILTKLDPYASNGVTTLATLRDELVTREKQLEQAISKSKAENWRERVMAAVQSLVIVRPLHGGDNAALTQVEMLLDKGHDDEALAAIKQLPDAARQSISDWQKQLQERVDIDNELSAIVTALTSKLTVKAP